MTKLSRVFCISMVIGDSSPSEAMSPELENREVLRLPDSDSSILPLEQAKESDVPKLVTESLSTVFTESLPNTEKQDTEKQRQREERISSSDSISSEEASNTERLTLPQSEGEQPENVPDHLEKVIENVDRPKQEARLRGEASDEQTNQVRRARWSCWIPDPTCRRSFEVNATTAYAMRFVQVGSKQQLEAQMRHSALLAYEASLLFATNTQADRRFKYNVFSLGPMGGIAASDAHDLWGSFGFAGRYWLGRGQWSPAVELHGLLNFKLRGSRGNNPIAQRSPIGFRGDLGVNIGGWGAIVVGGEYQVPLITDGIPEGHHISAGGMFYAGFRGNILWGLPAATAVGTHILVNR